MQLFFYLFNKIKLLYSNNPDYWEFYHDIYFCNGMKFNLLSKYYQNEDFINIFYTLQKMIRGFSKLSRIYTYKRATIKNTHDLGFNPIAQGNRRKTISILDNKSIYIMSLQELIQIINGALSYVNGFFILSSYVARNPYTNTQFNKSTLYNIYFAVKQSDYTMPPLFHSFFLEHFDLNEFVRLNNGPLLEYALNRHVYKSHWNVLYDDAMEMLAGNALTIQLQISKDFPKDLLVDILRPYLHIYMRIQYVNLGNEEWFHLSGELCDYLSKFYIFNPRFGRKYIHTKRKNEITFNKDHITFIKPKNRTLTSFF